MAHHLAPAIPILIASLAVPIAIWTSLYAVWAGQRTNGRRAVETELRRLGERAISIENVPLRALAARTGLTGWCVFRVSARAADGSARSHLWAYDPGLVARRNGLKHLKRGIWIPLA